MSTIMLSAVWPLELSPTQKLVLVSLADQANDEGVCWPSIASLQRRTCLSERAIRNALRELEGARYLRTNSRDGSSNWYTVTPRAGTPAPGAPRQDVPPPPAPRAPHPGTTCPPPRHQVPPEPSLNPQGTTNEPSRRGKRAPEAQVDLPEWVPRDAWADWLEVRRKLRAPATAKALALNLRSLEQLRAQGQDPRAVLEQSTTRGWRALFPLKNNGPHDDNANPFARRRGESAADHSARINRIHDERERAAAAGGVHAPTVGAHGGHVP